MICNSCNIDRLVTDFINNQKYCFRCEFRNKVEKKRKKTDSNKMYCRICKKEFVHIEELKKRQRTVFCSASCALKGHKEMKENHWTRIVRNNRYGDIKT